MKRIKIFGLHRKTGATRRYWFDAGLNDDYSRAARKVLELESANYFVVVVDPYDDVWHLRNGQSVHEQGQSMVGECASEIESPVKYPYKVHSINTVNQQRQGSHVGFVETLDEALIRAEGCVNSWSPKHKGVVIFKAIILVRKHDSPIEITDL
jgi:hypothetical protein